MRTPDWHIGQLSVAFSATYRVRGSCGSYGGTSRDFVGNGDADGSMAEDRRAVSGFTSLIDGGVVSGSSKRQEIASLLTTESAYVAATHATKETL